MGRFKLVSHDVHNYNANDRFSIPYVRYILEASFMPEGAAENEKFMYGRDVFNDLKEIDVKLANFVYGRTISCDIKKVIFNPPATIVLWEDGTKTVVKSYEKFDVEKGLAMAIAKKALGNKGNYYNVFTKWTTYQPDEPAWEDPRVSLEEMADKMNDFSKTASKFKDFILGKKKEDKNE